MMQEEEVVELMLSSKSEEEWNANCDAVKEKCGGYPQFWYEAIIRSGVSAQVTKNWK